MPSITDLKAKQKTSNLFKKKDYRPWDNQQIDTTATQPSPKILLKDITISSDPRKKKKSKSNTLEKNNIDIELDKTWRSLYGARKIVLGLVIQSVDELHNDFVVTSAITTSQLMSGSSLPINTIKSTLQQLKQDSFIENYETKPGRGGFARYKICKSTYEYFNKKFSSKI